MIDVMEIDIDRPEKIVYVVGLGPGEPFYMTQQAANTLENVDAICGYKVYLDLIRDEFPCEEYYSTGMTQEIDRCPQRRGSAGCTAGARFLRHFPFRPADPVGGH